MVERESRKYPGTAVELFILHDGHQRNHAAGQRLFRPEAAQIADQLRRIGLHAGDVALEGVDDILLDEIDPLLRERSDIVVAFPRECGCRAEHSAGDQAERCNNTVLLPFHDSLPGDVRCGLYLHILVRRNSSRVTGGDNATYPSSRGRAAHPGRNFTSIRWRWTRISPRISFQRPHYGGSSFRLRRHLLKRRRRRNCRRRGSSHWFFRFSRVRKCQRKLQ